MRISPIAPYGSLLKGAAAVKAKGKPKGKPAKSPRQTGVDHLAAIRKCPCLGCGKDPAGVAAHLRMTKAGKPITGMSTKPNDRYALPLCADCHTDGSRAQHKIGEAAYWSGLGLDPFHIADRLFAASPNVTKMRAISHAEREHRK